MSDHRSCEADRKDKIASKAVEGPCLQYLELSTRRPLSAKSSAAEFDVGDMDVLQNIGRGNSRCLAGTD